MDKRLSKYLRHGYRAVGGWLLPGGARIVAAIGKCQEALGIAGNVAEIGVHHGKLFILLYLLTRPEERAVAVDLFSLQHMNVDGSGAGNLSRFLRNLRRHADTERLIVHEGNSTQLDGAALIRLGGGPFRLISIDGGHTAEITSVDLATAEGALALGGVIILDDCFNEFWPGVSDGVHQYFSVKRSIVPFAIGGGKTLFCDPDFAARYADALHPLTRKTAGRSFLGSPVSCHDFALNTWEEYFGEMKAWKRIKDFPPMKLARRLYWATRRSASTGS